MGVHNALLFVGAGRREEGVATLLFFSSINAAYVTCASAWQCERGSGPDSTAGHAPPAINLHALNAVYVGAWCHE